MNKNAIASRMGFILLCALLVLPAPLYARIEAPRAPAETDPPTSAATSSPTATNTSPIPVTYEASDPGVEPSGIAEVTLLYQFDSGGWITSTYTSTLATGTFNFVPADGEGVYDFQTIAEDVDGNVEAQNPEADTSTIYDLTDPINPAITIDDGEAYTGQITVTLTLSAEDPGGSDVSEMAFSNDNISWDPAVVYATSAEWQLDGVGDGLKTVYAQFWDAAGNPSEVVSDTITLDRAGPTNGSVQIDGGADFTNQITVTLDLLAQDATSAVDEMTFSNDNISWESAVPYATTAEWQLDGVGDGLKTVYAQFWDAAGNPSEVVSDTITLDSAGPTNGSVLIDSDADFTNQITVTLDLLAQDATGAVDEMAFSNDNISWESAVPYATTAEWQLDGVGDGLKTVYAQFWDEVGNPSAVVSDTITLDRVAPAAVTVTSPSFVATTTPFTVTWSATDDATPITYDVRYRENDGGWNSLLDDVTITETLFSLAGLGNNYTFEVTATDAAGNPSTPATDTTRVGYYYLYLPITLRNYDPLTNGSFEGGLRSWTVSQSPLPVSVVTSVAERPTGSTAPADGDQAVVLGNPAYACSSSGVPLGYAGIEQTIVVADDATNLVFNYIIYTQDAMPVQDAEYFDRFEVYINTTLKFADGNTVNAGLDCSVWRRIPGPENPRHSATSGWATEEIDLTPYRGQSITIRFRNYSRFDHWFNTYTYVDNVHIETAP